MLRSRFGPYLSSRVSTRPTWPSGAPAALAAGVAAHRELRLRGRLVPQSRFRHQRVLPFPTGLAKCRSAVTPVAMSVAFLEREPERPQQRAALLVVGRRGDEGDVH